MSWKLLAGIALAGGAGSVLRFVAGTALTRLGGNVFPYGTLVVNLVGCLLFGVVAGLALEGRVLTRDTALVLTAGFLGGLTTFSSFGFELFEMLDRRAIGLFALYVSGSVGGGIAAVWLGMRLVR